MYGLFFTVSASVHGEFYMYSEQITATAGMADRDGGVATAAHFGISVRNREASCLTDLVLPV